MVAWVESGLYLNPGAQWIGPFSKRPIFTLSLSLSVSDASFAPTPSVINVSRERIAACNMNRLHALGGNYVDYNTYLMELLEESVYRELRWVNMGLIAVLFNRKERRRRDQ